MIRRLLFAISTANARWLQSYGQAHEFGYIHRNSLRLAIQKATGLQGAFAFWRTGDEAIRPGDTMRIETEEFGMLELLVVRSIQTDRHGTYGTAVPSIWQQQAAMEAAWQDFRRQADRELEMLRQVVYGLVAQSPGSTVTVPWSYFTQREPVEVELIPDGEGVFVRVTAGEVRHG